MNLQHIIADNLKAIREGKKLTLDAAAKQTGVSRSMLAQIEKGDVNPTISVLWKIANGYKVSFTSLMEDKSQAASIIRNEEIVPLVEDDGRFLNYPTFPFDDKRLFETYRIVIKPAGFLQAEAHMANTEEYVTVFSGEVEICAGSAVYRLRTGDSLRFRCDTAHSYKNVGADTAALSMLIYYASK